MKQFYSIVLSVLAFNWGYSAPVIRLSVNNGSWNTNSTWDLNRLPQSGDTVIITAGKTVILNNNISISGDIYIKVVGALNFSSGKLTISSNSTVLVYYNGHIAGTGAPSEQLKLGNSQIFDGSNAPVWGPMIANQTTNGFVADTALPVKFVGFTVSHSNNNVLIQWSTAEEMNAAAYEVERSFDGSNWDLIGSIAAIGNSATLNNYSFTDMNPSARVIYYRIKQVDINGQFIYTSIRSLKAVETNAEVKIAGVQGEILLQFSQAIKGNVLVQLVSLSGQVVEQKTISQAVGQVVVNTSVKGNYIINLTNGRDLNLARQVNL